MIQTWRGHCYLYESYGPAHTTWASVQPPPQGPPTDFLGQVELTLDIPLLIRTLEIHEKSRHATLLLILARSCGNRALHPFWLSDIPFIPFLTMLLLEHLIQILIEHRRVISDNHMWL